MDEYSSADVRRAAMDFLARREHSRHELQLKLKRRYPDEDIVTEVLQQLACENLQSDERFAEAYVRSRAGRGYGPMRLRQELAGKGITADTLERGLDQCKIDWKQLAREVHRKKFGDEPPIDAREKARRARFMYQRGFEFSGNTSLGEE